jgi:hypothetical protein
MTAYCRRGDTPGTAPPSIDVELVGKPAAWENLDEQYGLDLDDEDDDITPVSAAQTVEEEYNVYTTATLSPRGTDMLTFWQVSIIYVATIIIY